MEIPTTPPALEETPELIPEPTPEPTPEPKLESEPLPDSEIIEDIKPTEGEEDNSLPTE